MPVRDRHTARWDRAHRYARQQPPGRLYAVVRALATWLLRSWFRIDVTGVEHLPDGRGAIVAANAFFIGVATRRDARTMAKATLFRVRSDGCSCASARSRSAAARRCRGSRDGASDPPRSWAARRVP